MVAAAHSDDYPNLPDSPADPETFQALIAESKRLESEINAILPLLASARRNYMRSRSEEDRAEMDRVQSIASDLHNRHSALYDGLKQASGLSGEMLEWIDKPHVSADEKNRLLRHDLIEQNVEITCFVDTQLGEALENIKRIVPSVWLAEQPQTTHRLDRLFSGAECLSIVKRAAAN